jgi:hypothetical protein
MKLKGIPVKGVKIKDGKLTNVAYYADASAAIRAKKSKRARVVRRQPT